jgi:hypothetical protein
MAGGTNPNGANQYVLDPRQKLCWDLYVNPNSETFGNGFKSAIKAGYEEGTAAQITTFPWFVDRLRRLNMLEKAEKVLDKTLEMTAVDEQGKVQVDLLRVQTDVAKHLTKTLGKEHYSERTEHTGKDGEQLVPTPILTHVLSNDSNQEGNESKQAA